MADSDFSTLAELLALDVIEKGYRDAILSKNPDLPSYQFNQQAIHDTEVEKALLTHDLFGEDKQAARAAVNNFDIQSYGIERFKTTVHKTQNHINSMALSSLDFASKRPRPFAYGEPAPPANKRNSLRSSMKSNDWVALPPKPPDASKRITLMDLRVWVDCPSFFEAANVLNVYEFQEPVARQPPQAEALRDLDTEPLHSDKYARGSERMTTTTG